MSRLTDRFIVGAGVVAGLLSIFIFSGTTLAVSGSDWNPSNIMDDSIFFNGGDMSTGDIQNFLNAKLTTCNTYHARSSSGNDSGPPYTCLKNYSENPTTKQNNGNAGGGASVPGGWSAAQIIKHAADTYNVSPKALIVLLQKEQSLITDDWPWANQYRSATGYGCPDTAPCDAEYYGFYNQVMKAAYQFKRYATYPSDYRYKAFQSNFIQWNPNAGCGGSNVGIQNQTTAGLYNYTPYQPNGAALANLYGTGDGCSAYGNRNFWRLYNDWFGSTYVNYVKDTDGDGILDPVDLCVTQGGPSNYMGCPTNNITESNSVSGDFNGDGYGDVLVFSIYPNGAAFNIWLFPGSVNGLGAPVFQRELGPTSGGWSFASTKPAVTDVNNDNYDDLVIFHKGPNNEIVRHVLKGSGSGVQASDSNMVAWQYPNQGWLWSNVRIVGGGDFNGDGYGDVLAFSIDPNGAAFNIWTFPGSASASGLGAPVLQQSLGPNSGGWNFKSSKPAITDVNRDNYSDLVIFHRGPGNEIVRHVLKGSSSGIQASDSNMVAWQYPNQGWLWSNAKVVGGGDFNGDTYGDVLLLSVDPNGALFNVWLLPGSGLASGLGNPVFQRTLGPNSGGWNFNSSKATITNVNHDNYSDLVIFHKGPNNEIVRHVLKGSGSGVQASDSSWVTWQFPSQGWLWTNARLVGGN